MYLRKKPRKTQVIHRTSLTRSSAGVRFYQPHCFKRRRSRIMFIDPQNVRYYANYEETRERDLRVCCPHVITSLETGTALVVDGGALALTEDVRFLRGKIGGYIDAHEGMVHQLRKWMTAPGKSSIQLVGHMGCSCSFLRKLDAQEVREVLTGARAKLEEWMYARHQVSTSVILHVPTSLCLLMPTHPLSHRHLNLTASAI